MSVLERVDGKRFLMPALERAGRPELFTVLSAVMFGGSNFMVHDDCIDCIDLNCIDT